MSSTTKKTIIDSKSKKNIDELKSTTDIYKELSNFKRQINYDTNVKKSRLVSEIYGDGKKLVDEIENKQKNKEIKRLKIIEEIYEISKEDVISIIDANKLTLEELQPILFKIKEQKKSWLQKIFDFIMGY